MRLARFIPAAVAIAAALTLGACSSTAPTGPTAPTSNPTAVAARHAQQQQYAKSLESAIAKHKNDASPYPNQRQAVILIGAMPIVDPRIAQWLPAQTLDTSAAACKVILSTKDTSKLVSGVQKAFVFASAPKQISAPQAHQAIEVIKQSGFCTGK